MSAPAPGSIASTDTLVGPIVAQLATVAQQIAGVGRCYTDPPEGEPEDNSVIFPLKSFKVLDDTSGKLYIELVFAVTHLFRRTRLQDAIARAQAFLPAWLLATSAWGNQSLGGLAILVEPQHGTLASTTWGEQTYAALVTQVRVLTEFNILTS